MTIAIVGLVGVVIGGLLNGGLTLLLEEHRMKRAAKADGRLLLFTTWADAVHDAVTRDPVSRAS